MGVCRIPLTLQYIVPTFFKYYIILRLPILRKRRQMVEKVVKGNERRSCGWLLLRLQWNEDTISEKKTDLEKGILALWFGDLAYLWLFLCEVHIGQFEVIQELI